MKKKRVCKFCKGYDNKVTKHYGCLICQDCLGLVDKIVKDEIYKDSKNFLKIPRNP